ncbi:MAG: 50S ribosomal protein L24P [Candidatus Heimdallarchaeota archaeon LC_2]|nr:MAG: 50S ribosomal protein L24P [Candidatus Heimdallarchaeota archaeon LC_2]
MRTQSKKPKKQRLFQFNPPRHETHKLLSANLSISLRETKGFRSLPLRKGDTVTITRGDMKGKSGKVMKVDLSKQRVYVDKIVKRKTDNTEIPFPIHASNLVITNIIEKDRKRLELINRRIKKEEDKIDIDAVLAETEEDEDIIELEDEDLIAPLDDDDIELLEEDTTDDLIEDANNTSEEDTITEESTEKEDDQQ